RGLDDRCAVVRAEFRGGHHELLAAPLALSAGPGLLPRSSGDAHLVVVGPVVVGPVVVGPVDVAHQAPPPTAKAATAPPSSVTAARAACCHIFPTNRVVTTGSGGSPYTSGSSSRR